MDSPLLLVCQTPTPAGGDAPDDGSAANISEDGPRCDGAEIVRNRRQHLAGQRTKQSK